MEARMQSDTMTAKQVLRYFKGIVAHVIRMCYIEGKLIVYADVDWTGEISDRKSTSVLLCKIERSPIFWNSCKQKDFSMSSAEADYISAIHATEKVMWIQSLLKELEWNRPSPQNFWKITKL